MYGNFNDGQRGRGFAPVNEGEEYDVKIEAVGEKGDGIARVKGFVLFVPNTKEGDEIRVKVTKVLRKVGFAEMVGKGRKEEEKEEPQEEEPAEEEKIDYDEDSASEDFGEDEEADESVEDDSEEEIKE
ncbi:MAG: TRAM domain-containing protein [Nanoarchaeota archaeon]|nr:TRAM domain-containing protein [Nanoarchaeota archaeon]MBU1031003.1 TRAM domain-containing protein [Nanoarchaeota archaeon]MBU1849463.1 TRAM domain-containing protein [Nanoarchaeota archaeon]